LLKHSGNKFQQSFYATRLSTSGHFFCPPQPSLVSADNHSPYKNALAGKNTLGGFPYKKDGVLIGNIVKNP